MHTCLFIQRWFGRSRSSARRSEKRALSSPGSTPGVAAELATRYPLPGAFLRLLELRAEAPGASATLAETLDAVLDTERLRLAFLAALRNPSDPLTGVSDSLRLIARHGYRRVHSAALVTTFLAAFELEARSFDWLDFWRHSMSVALTTQFLVQAGPEADFAFATGLLHDISLLLLDFDACEAVPELVSAPKGRGTPEGHNLEREILGFSLDDLTVFVMSAWGLPQAVLAAVAEQDSGTARGRLGACLATAIEGSASLGFPCVHRDRGGKTLPRELSAFALTTLRRQYLRDIDRSLGSLLAIRSGASDGDPPSLPG